MKRSMWLLLTIMPLLLVAAARKQNGTVAFYTEGNPGGADTSTFSAPVQLQYPPRKSYISRVPSITERDIVGVYLFLAGDGSWGCSFFLDDHGRIMLDTLSIEKRGTSLVAIVNGRQVIDMLIDKRVSDGIVTIQHGLNNDDARSLKKEFRLLNPARLNPKTQGQNQPQGPFQGQPQDQLQTPRQGQ